MLKREAREILSLEDDPDLKLRVRAHLRHLRAAARAARPRRAQDRLQAGQRAHLLPRALPAAGPLDRQAGARAVRADPGPRGHRGERALLRDRRHLRAEGREVRHRDGGRRGPVRPGSRVRAPPRSRATARPAAGRSATPPGRSRCTRSTTCTAPTGSERLELVVGIVVVSHSDGAGRGRGRRWRARWAATELALEAAGGTDGARRARDRRRARAGGDRARDVSRRRARADGPRQRADEHRVRDRAARRRPGTRGAERGAAGRGRRSRPRRRRAAARRSTRWRPRRAARWR